MIDLKFNNMKNKLRYIACILSAVLIGSCTDEEKYPLPEYTRSSIPVFTPGEADTGFINFLDFNESNISFDVTTDGMESVTGVDVLVTFNNAQTGESETITYNTVTSFPQTISLTFDQLVGLFPSDVVTADTLGLGDSFVVGGNVTLADGRYLEGGYSPSIIGNQSVFLIYNVACTSALAGTYDFSLVSGTNGEVASLTDQTITEISPGYYEISDGTMDIFGTDFPVKFRFTDICGNLTADVGSVDFGTQITLQFNPDTAVDPVTGEITFSIEYIAPSCCGLGGIKTVFKATPK
jgi:hypothetical protein